MCRAACLLYALCSQQHTSRHGRGQADDRSVAEARPRGLAVARSRDAASSSQRGPGRGRVASARRRVGAGGARPRLRRWCASFSSPRSRRADPRLAPTKNSRRQRRGPAKRQRRGSAADAKSPLRLLLMGRVEPPDCHDQEPFKELKIPHLNLKKTQTVGVLYWLHCLKGIAKW